MRLDVQDRDHNALRERLHPRCIACSPARADGFRLDFVRTADGGVATDLDCADDLEGYPGLLHGGVISLVFDSAMANCMFARGYRAVTAELSVRFSSPVSLGAPARITARIVKDMHPLYYLEAQLSQRGAEKARATAKFMVQEDGDLGPLSPW
jgi:acyl-coenzyme A thioesterase PaaI-like protein